jgi:glycosyltransferase involved in cell wall biosynthesis
MMTSKVMQVVYNLEPGGSEGLSRDIILGLDPRTFSSSICALAGGGALESELKKERVPCYVMNRRSGFDKSLPWRLYRVFQRDRVDIVQTHHFGQLIYSVFGARMAGARLIHVEHEYYSIQSRKAQRRLRWLSRWCDAVVGVSEGVSEFLRKEVGIPSSKVRTIRNGVDCQRFAPRQFSTRDEAGFSTTDVLIGTVARLEPEKDLLVLLEAFHRVRMLYSNAKLLIVGDGSLKGSLGQHTSHLGLTKDVMFLGWRSDIPALLGLFDIFVLSSFEEGLPLVILEAMAAAKPVVATAVGGIPDVISSCTGFLVPRRDPERLAGALQTLVLDPTLRNTLGRAGRMFVESRYNLRDTVKGYQRLYETMV